MVTQYGMSELGYAVVSNDTVRMGGPVADRVHLRSTGCCAVHSTRRARSCGSTRAVRVVAETLLEQETLDREDITAIVKSVRPTAVA